MTTNPKRSFRLGGGSASDVVGRKKSGFQGMDFFREGIQAFKPSQKNWVKV